MMMKVLIKMEGAGAFIAELVKAGVLFEAEEVDQYGEPWIEIKFNGGY